MKDSRRIFTDADSVADDVVKLGALGVRERPAAPSFTTSSATLSAA